MELCLRKEQPAEKPEWNRNIFMKFSGMCKHDQPEAILAVLLCKKIMLDHGC